MSLKGSLCPNAGSCTWLFISQRGSGSRSELKIQVFLYFQHYPWMGVCVYSGTTCSLCLLNPQVTVFIVEIKSEGEYFMTSIKGWYFGG